VQEFRERGFLPQALLNQLFRLGHTGDAERWLSLAEMPAHFLPSHLGRAPARFDETQLLHWQKETLARLSDAEVGAWLGVPDDPPFVATVRHNVVLPADAAPWIAAVRGELPPLGESESRVVRTAGAAFFDAALAALGESGADWKRLTALVRERTGAQGASLYMPLRIALTGQAHGPELGPLLKLMNPATARRRLEAHAKNP
jgi:glutamyl-tRNA synthetase